MLGATQAIYRRARVSDRVAIAALLAYALAIGALIGVPIVRERLALSTNHAYEPAPPHRGEAVSAEQLVLAPQFENAQPERSAHVARTWRKVGGVGVNVVTVNPKAANVNVALGLAHGTVLSEGKFGRESFGDMVRRLKPRAAINGTYFNLRTNEPVGSLVMEGRLIYDGLCSSTLFANERGDVWMEYRPGKHGRDFGWSREIRTAICSGPLLVKGGNVALHPGDEGFGDPALFALARRSAVGVTAEGKLLLVTVHTPITLNKLAHIMIRLDAVDAMNLDGGSSSGLYSNGQFVTVPDREITNILLVYD